MKILIAYGSTEGQTRKVVNAIAKQINELGHEAKKFDTSDLLGELHPNSFDRIIVAGSVHEQMHQESLEFFVVAHREQLKTGPALFLSISLAAAFDNGMGDAQSYVDHFSKNTGWHPQKSLMVAGAVRHGEYGLFKEHILEHIVLKGRDLEDPASDHEFTNWERLSLDIAEFIAS